jgi:secondary thiamine-phosphate synthase enzyme
MKIFSKEIIFKTRGFTDIININEKVYEILEESKISDGICNIFSVGSTGGLTSIEYEPGLIKDLPALFEKLIPSTKKYKHDDTWGDGNGFSHLRSSLLKTFFNVPVVKGELTLGIWQQIVFIDFDNRPRDRKIIVQIIGE